MDSRIIIAKIDISTALLKYAAKVGGFENLSIMIDAKDKRVPLEVQKEFAKLRQDIFEVHFEALDEAANAVTSERPLYN